MSKFRLVDYHPEWIDHDGRRGLGLIMRSPLLPEYRLVALFTNPFDGGEPWPGDSRTLLLKLFPVEEERIGVVGCGKCRWKRKGETFETLTLQPSVNAYSLGHFSIDNGGWDNITAR